MDRVIPTPVDFLVLPGIGILLMPIDLRVVEKITAIHRWQPAFEDL